MKPIYAVAVYVPELIEDSPGMLAFFAWIAGTIGGVAVFQSQKVPYGPFWGFVLGLGCAAAAWGFCWACGKGVKALHRVHRPESKDLKKACESK